MNGSEKPGRSLGRNFYLCNKNTIRCTIGVPHGNVILKKNLHIRTTADSSLELRFEVINKVRAVNIFNGRS